MKKTSRAGHLQRSLETFFPNLQHDKRLHNIVSVQVDSRNVTPGALFFALKGAKTDGHNFIQDAIDNGASGVVVVHGYKKIDSYPPDLLVLEVFDTLFALQEITKIQIERISPKIIAITGSLGKTTTKEFVKTLIEIEKRVFSPSGNKNSQIGMPLSILNDSAGDEEIYILEMGMTHKGNIARLVEIAPPHIALITSVEYVHAENFQDISEIALAKAEIFSSQKTEMRILHHETNAKDIQISSSPIPYKTYSLSHDEKERASLSIIRSGSQLICFEDGKKVYEMKDPQFISTHIYENLLAAIAIVRQVGISWKAIEQRVDACTTPSQRMELIEKSDILFINDSYNASGPSMLSALRTLQEISATRKARSIAILGQINELGRFSEEIHRQIARAAITSTVLLFCFGKEAQYTHLEAEKRGFSSYWTDSFSELVEECKKCIRQTDVVLLKGSHSNGLWRILESFTGEE